MTQVIPPDPNCFVCHGTGVDHDASAGNGTQTCGCRFPDAPVRAPDYSWRDHVTSVLDRHSLEIEAIGQRLVSHDSELARIDGDIGRLVSLTKALSEATGRLANITAGLQRF